MSRARPRTRDPRSAPTRPGAAGPGSLRVDRVVTVLAAAAVLAQAADFAHSLRDALVRPQATAPTRALGGREHLASTPAHRATFDPERVAAAHLFGRADGPPVAASAIPDERLALAGTIAFERPDKGYALLALQGTTLLHRAGDRLDNGAVLAGVWADRVALARGAVTQIVELPRAHVTSDPAVAVGEVPVVHVERRAAAPANLPAEEPSDASPAAHHALLVAQRVRERGARLARVR